MLASVLEPEQVAARDLDLVQAQARVQVEAQVSDLEQAQVGV